MTWFTPVTMQRSRYDQLVDAGIIWGEDAAIPVHGQEVIATFNFSEKAESWWHRVDVLEGVVTLTPIRLYES
jgi:hypothetical protein